MTLTKTIVVLICLGFWLQLSLPATSQAKLYTWTDRYGIVRRTYYPPPPDQVGQNPSPEQSAASQRQVRSNSVELYVTAWCPYCKKAIKYFQDKGIDFTVYDIEKDREAARRKSSLDGRDGVPFAVINGVGVHGYSPEQYAQALQ